MEGEQGKNWSEKVEDLVDSGETDAAISLLETLISDLQIQNTSDSQSQLASALLELAKLYSSKGLSLKSDEARSRATAINLRSLHSLSPPPPLQSSSEDSARQEQESRVSSSASDDWEAIADRAPDELVSPQSVPEVSKLSLKDSKTETQAPKRRGRGTFNYKKQGLYSDQQVDESVTYDSPEEFVHDKPQKASEARNVYGTRHVLVLDGFNPSTTTTDLERFFEEFKDCGFSIRWINDTRALAVFQSPSIALEACNSVNCPFSVRVFEEDDPIVNSISFKDLDPPRQRPKTSARTAQRLIAHELGVKLPSTFGSRELRKQEEARRKRIISRQTLRDDAWGPEDAK